MSVSALERPVAIPELERDEIAREQSAQFIRAVGTHAVKAAVSYEAESVAPIESLYDAIQEAAKGSEAGLKMVEINAKTDVIERTMKSGHITEVFMNIDEVGAIQQNGQSLESIQENSLRFAANNPKMRPRVEAETRNAFRLRQEYSQGELRDHSFVVFSCTADDMTASEKEKAGFFTDTMSCAIQVTTEKESELSIESAFVSGLKHPGDVRGDNARVDIETVIAIGQRFGVDFSGKTATEILDTPILIPNSMLKNGVLDVVQMWDEHHGDTFFGEVRKKQDYQTYRERCREREETLQPKVDLIKKKLISEAHLIKNRLDAVKRLSAISADEMIQQAIFDAEINPAVFGAASESYIYEARKQAELGNYDQVLKLKDEAIRYDTSSSCPNGISSADSEARGGKDSESCTFVSKKCPECGAKNVVTKVTSSRISGSCGCSKRK